MQGAVSSTPCNGVVSPIALTLLRKTKHLTPAAAADRARPSVPSQLSALRNLTTLNYADNRIHGTIPTQIAKLTTLKFLNLKGNKDNDNRNRNPRQQIFTGDGSNRSFVLDRSVGTENDIQVQVGNTLQIPTTDYTATGTALTFGAGSVPADSSAITVVYRAGALQTVVLDTTSFQAGSEGSPTINHVSQNTTGIYFPSTSRIGFVTNGNKRVEINNSITASSTTTGAFQVTGGMGVTQRLYVGGIVNCTSTQS